jgi:hypothetical protein
MQDSDEQLFLMQTVIDTSVKLRSECRALDLLHRATILLTHPLKAVRAQASLMYSAYLGEDARDSAITCAALKASLLQECRSVCCRGYFACTMCL